MKTVILAGGYGTRLSEVTNLLPKPMVEIGTKPILWHIMKIYSHFGLNDFIICLGYKGYLIKEYFANYFLHSSDVTFDMSGNQMVVHKKNVEPWRVTLVDTGENTMTGGRIKRIKDYVGNEDFCLTYGDGVGNIDIAALLELHKKENKHATVTAVIPEGRFGAIEYENNAVKKFKEKPKGDGAWINGGFFVCKPEIFNYIKNEQTIWEQDPMQKLAAENQMAVHFHDDFWQPMDTLREKNLLENLWNEGKAPWKIW